MVGFTEAEVRRLLSTCRDLGVFDQDIDTAMGTMGEWYGGYRFAREVETDLYHPAMVLSYLDRSMPNREMTDDLIDTNAGVDDARLRPLLVAGRRPNDNLDVLRDVIEEAVVVPRIQSSLPLERLAEPENLFLPPALLRVAEYPRRGAWDAAAGSPQPDREAADPRLPARRPQRGSRLVLTAIRRLGPAAGAGRS